jgi:hypothetical protein
MTPFEYFGIQAFVLVLFVILQFFLRIASYYAVYGEYDAEPELTDVCETRAFLGIPLLHAKILFDAAMLLAAFNWCAQYGSSWPVEAPIVAIVLYNLLVVYGALMLKAQWAKRKVVRA